MKARRLIFLSVLAGVLTLAAIAAVMMRETANLAPFSRQPLFPGLEQKIEQIARIELRTATGDVNLSRDAKGGWMLPERGGWPANFDVVRKAVLGLAKLQAVDRRTARPENHAHLLLAAPDDPDAAASGKGALIRALDAQGEVMASLIIGRVQTPPSATTPGSAFARREGEAQTYLVEGDVNFPLQVSDWVDRRLFDIHEDRIRSVKITPPSGPAYEITRATPQDPFTIDRIPKGMEFILPDLPANIAKTVALLPLEDALPDDKVDFTGAYRAEHKMFDGLALTSYTVLRDKSRWTKFTAAFDASQAEAAEKAKLLEANPKLLNADAAQKQADEINARTKGWAFKLPGMKASDLTRDYESLFRTPEPEKKSGE